MTLDLETKRLLGRIRDASCPEEERVARVRLALLAQISCPISEATGLGESASPVAGSLTLGKWMLASVFLGTLVLSGSAALGLWPSPLPPAAHSVTKIDAPSYQPPVPPSPRQKNARQFPGRPAANADAWTGAPRPAVERKWRGRAQPPDATERVAAHSDLDAQVELLSRALLALRELKPAEARRLLQQHLALYPQSPLIPERESALGQLNQLEAGLAAPDALEAR